MGDFLVRIYYEDTDCGGIVYHTNYIKYCERARSEIFFSAGILPNTERIGFVVRKLNTEFLDSAKLGDLLVVKTKIMKLGQTSLTLLQEIYCSTTPSLRGVTNAEAIQKSKIDCHESANADSRNDNVAPKLIFQCEVKLACIDIKRKKIVKIPDKILVILQTKF